MGLIRRLFSRPQKVTVTTAPPRMAQPPSGIHSKNVSSLEQPSLDLAPFGFENTPYSCLTNFRIDESRNIKTELSKTFFANENARDTITQHILWLEQIVNGVGLGEFNTNVSAIGFTEPGKPPARHSPSFHLNPLTKTGKLPKNVLETTVNTGTAGIDSKHEVWHINFLANGKVNKADAYYWERQTCYAFHIRRKGDSLYVSWAETIGNDSNWVPIYRAE